MDQTNGQIAEQYIRSVYPCIDHWISFVQKVYPKSKQFDAISCARLSLIGSAARKTFDYILTRDQNVSVIRVARLLSDMNESAWKLWTAFYALSDSTTGTRSVTFSSDVLDNVKMFDEWDYVLDDAPIFDPPSVLDSILQGVTLP